MEPQDQPTGLPGAFAQTTRPARPQMRAAVEANESKFRLRHEGHYGGEAESSSDPKTCAETSLSLPCLAVISTRPCATSGGHLHSLIYNWQSSNDGYCSGCTDNVTAFCNLRNMD